MALKKLAVALLFFTAGIAASAQDGKKIRILLAGDSTVQDVDHSVNPDWGWGQVLPRFFNDDTEVINIARGGRSTRTFIEEGRWDSLNRLTRPGDYVFIQFGHNDQAVDRPDRYTTPEDYKRNLERFVRETRTKGATPVLVTPVTRRNFDASGEVVYKHGVYPSLVKEVAEDMNVDFIDLKSKSRTFIKTLGPEGSVKVYINIEPGVDPRRPDGVKDNTHFSEYGATEMAKLVIEGIRENNLQPLTAKLK